MPPAFGDPEGEESIRRAERATLILWIAVATVALIALAAMFWT